MGTILNQLFSFTMQTREKENKEKWEKTWMNQAVQQKKVAAIVSQLQNTGSTPNLTSHPAVGKLEQNNMENIKNLQNTQELITFDDVIDS